MDKFDLISLTDEFFHLHWNFSNTPPKWNFSWDLIGSLPNFELGGVYALFSDAKVIYIGVGNSLGDKRYRFHGLSRRMMSHVYRNAPKDSTTNYVFREKWLDMGVTNVATIGLPKEFNYLAPALEEYLIWKLSPPCNLQKRHK